MHDACATDSFHPSFLKVVMNDVQAQQTRIAGAP
jgi:hypothetical protein